VSDQPVEREAGLRGRLLEMEQLAARFIQMAPEALQVLLHELGYLGKHDRTDHTQGAIQQAFARAQYRSTEFHAAKLGAGLWQRKPVVAGLRRWAVPFLGNAGCWALSLGYRRPRL
jgi:hypothetical protein